MSQLTSQSTMEVVTNVIDHVANIISVALLPLYATPVGIALLGIFSTVGLTMRILAQKAENQQWEAFYRRTENEKRQVMSNLDDAIKLINEMEDGWQKLK